MSRMIGRLLIRLHSPCCCCRGDGLGADDVRWEDEWLEVGWGGLASRDACGVR